MNLRDTKYKKEVKYSFLFKILSIIISFLLVRFLLEYLGVDKYGVWSVILVFIRWIVFFDFGFANGIKNKVSAELASDNKIFAQEYVSTGYIVLGIFMLTVYSLLFFVSYFIDWQSVFNIHSVSNSELIIVIRVISFFLLFNFVLSIILSIFQAVQKSSLVVFSQFFSQFLSLVMVTLLLLFADSSLLFVSISYGLALVFSNFMMSYWFYRKYNYLKPSVSRFRTNKIKSISTLGMNFFILQITILVILSSDRMIILQLLGPVSVANYDILFKYFSIITVLHSIINAPLWAIYTEAYQKNDYIWIMNTLKRMIKIVLAYFIIAAILTVFGTYVIHLWINNDKIVLTLSNYIYMGILVIFLSWYSIFAYFTNGIEATSIQLYSSLLGAIINIPLSIYLVKYHDMGLNGVILATIISLSIFCILGPFQAVKVIAQMKNRRE